MTDNAAPISGGAPQRDITGVRSPLKRTEHPVRPLRAVSAGGPASNNLVLWLQSTAGNTATSRMISDVPKKTGAPSLQRAAGTPAAAASATPPAPDVPSAPPSGGNRVAFVREEGLNLRAGPNQASNSMAQSPFGTRVHVLEEESLHPGWQKATTPAAAVGFLSAPRVHFPPPDLIARDPGLTMIRVRSGQTFWGLVKEQYGIQGDESTADQNINHFINAIRAVNKGDAFIVDTDWLDDIGNWLVSGRDASDTLLKAGYDVWIPSFGVAAAMDVGSGTVTGEVARIVKKIEQKIEDFGIACSAAVKYAPEAIARHAGETAMGLLTGLIDFAIDAAKILAVSTAVGTLIGALFGGVGAVPGAEIGFEIGLMILEYYGLAVLIEAILGMAGSLVAQLGSFISQVWNAPNGDAKKLDTAGKTLADALGILVSALLTALAAYLMKKGGDALGKSKFASKVGETQLARWLADRQKMTTTTETLDPKKSAPVSGEATKGVGAQRTFTSSNPLEAETANTIEKALPGRVEEVGRKVLRSDGSTLTDYDVVGDDFVVEVSGGGGKGKSVQLRTISGSTPKRVAVYGPKMGPTVVKAIEAQGIPVFRNYPDLIRWIALTGKK